MWSEDLELGTWDRMRLEAVARAAEPSTRAEPARAAAAEPFATEQQVDCSSDTLENGGKSSDEEELGLAKHRPRRERRQAPRAGEEMLSAAEQMDIKCAMRNSLLINKMRLLPEALPEVRGSRVALPGPTEPDPRRPSHETAALLLLSLC